MIFNFFYKSKIIFNQVEIYIDLPRDCPGVYFYTSGQFGSARRI